MKLLCPEPSQPWAEPQLGAPAAAPGQDKPTFCYSVLSDGSRRAWIMSWDMCDPKRGSCPFSSRFQAQEVLWGHLRVTTLPIGLQTFSRGFPSPAPTFGHSGPGALNCPSLIFRSHSHKGPSLLFWENSNSNFLPTSSQILLLNHCKQQKLLQELHFPTQIKLKTWKGESLIKIQF